MNGVSCMDYVYVLNTLKYTEPLETDASIKLNHDRTAELGITTD